MTPDPRKTNLELAEELDRDAQIANRNGDYLSEQLWRDRAQELRAAEMEKQNGLRPSI